MQVTIRAPVYHGGREDFDAQSLLEYNDGEGADIFVHDEYGLRACLGRNELCVPNVVIERFHNGQREGWRVFVHCDDAGEDKIVVELFEDRFTAEVETYAKPARMIFDSATA